MKSYFTRHLKIIALLSLATCFGLYFFAINVYTLNRGFGIFDEGEYLQSYKMAAEGFYLHFTNTPFLVAALFERFQPGLIGYRAIHLLLSLLVAALFSLATIEFLEWAGLAASKLQKALFYALAFYGAMYAFTISETPLCYNHLNEFFVLTSEAFLLLGVVRRNRAHRASLFEALAGATVALDAYVKPPTFCFLVLISLCVIYFGSSKRQDAYRSAGWFALGFALSMAFTCLTVMSPAHWLEYWNHMMRQKPHGIVKMAWTLLYSALEILTSASGALLSGLALAGWLIFYPAFKVRAVSVVLVLLNVFFVGRLLFPGDLGESFQASWWYWWLYAATTFITVFLIQLFLGILVVLRKPSESTRKILLLVLLLALNPIMLTVGTLMGWGQVQFYLTSWLFGVAIVFLLLLQTEAKGAQIYSAVQIAVLLTVGFANFNRQLLPPNIVGGLSVFQQNRAMAELPLLKDVLVDQPTRDLLLGIKTIIDPYPNIPTLVFFDIPGLQYPFGRQACVPDPLLTNSQYPYMKDDEYNCRMITDCASKPSPSIFIVAGEKEMSNGLKNCMAQAGFPQKMELLGTVRSTLPSVLDPTEPIRIYLRR